MHLLKTKRTCYKFLFQAAVVLSSLFLVNSIAVARCGVLQLQKTDKPGVAVSNNSCTGSDIALNAIVSLQGDTSIRLDSSSGKPGASRHQLICQNQSSLPLTIRVTSAVSPWVQPEQGHIHCNGWLRDGRLECNEAKSGKKALICAISGQDNAIVLRGKLGKKSLKMRGPLQSDEADMEIEKGMEQVDAVLVNYVRPKIDQCRKKFTSDQVLTLSLTIKSNGVVIDTDIPQDLKHDEFVDCAIEVVEDWIFPSLKNDILVKRTF